MRGTRIGLGVLIWPLRRGETAEDLMEGFPSIGRERMQGIITFINEHPEAIDQYLKDEEERWEEVKRKFPVDPQIARALRKGSEKIRESA